MALLTGLIVGYVLAIPPGPIGMAAIRLGLRGRMTDVSQLAIGAGLLDLLYCLMAMWTSAGILDLVLPRGTAGEYLGLMTAAQIFISLAMIVAGIVVLISSRRHDIDEASNAAPALLGTVSRWRAIAPFATGVAFAITNLANPTFIPSLMIMSGTIRSAGLVGYSVPDVVQFSFGFGTGNALWLLTLGGIIRRFRHRLSERLLAGIRLVTATLLIGTGVFYGVSLGIRFIGAS
jgi:threonine/homoserine/homoserine lactone efflux protein